MRRTLLALAAAALLAACGGNGGNGQSQGGTETSMDHGAMSSTTQPPAGQAARTIKVSASDKLRFQPATLSVRQGETVAFTVTNSGKLVHEFVIGDQTFQNQHEQEMAGMTMPMGDDADGIGLTAGATKTLTYTFKQPGTLFYACHVSGHYKAGMKGTITVS